MTETVIQHTYAGPPGSLWATHDRRYGITTVHASREDAERERRREPGRIDVVEYRR